MRMNLLVTAGLAGISLLFTGFNASPVQAGDRSHARSSSHGGHSARHSGGHRNHARHDGGHRNHARHDGGHRNHARHDGGHRNHARHDGGHRNHARHDGGHRNHARHDGGHHNRHDGRRHYSRRHHGHSNFAFNIAFGGYGYGNSYGYPFYTGYDLYPWWYGNSYGYRGRRGYRSGYGHVGHSNIYCTDPYHQNYQSNWGNDYRDDNFAYSGYTDGSYGGGDVRDCHRETKRGVYGRRAAIVSSMVCYNSDGDYYEDTGAQTLVRYVS